MFSRLNDLEPFFKEPSREFNVREYARIMKIAPATASKNLTFYREEGFLKEREERRFKLYRADSETDAYQDIKFYYNIRKLKETGFIDFLNQFYLKPTIILFGSYARGRDDEASDIDLLIISEKEKIPILSEFEKKLNRKIQIFLYPDIKMISNKELINNIVNGFTLQGKIKWI